MHYTFTSSCLLDNVQYWYLQTPLTLYNSKGSPRLITGSIVHSAKRQYKSFSEGDFEVSRSQERHVAKHMTQLDKVNQSINQSIMICWKQINHC